MRRPLLITAAAVFVGFAMPSFAADDELVAIGARIYREGVLASGAPLRATGKNAMELTGADAACVSCHRRSGYGANEGRNIIRALPPMFDADPGGGAALRAKPVGSGRSHFRYTPESLGVALRDGIDSAGRPLAGLMPRFALDDASVRALAAYLETLSRKTAPGVSATALSFATIITPEASPESADAMLAVLQAYFTDKNGGSRSELRRRLTGSDWMYQGYRTWQLEVWKLTGSPDAWPEQLEEFYRRTPVFAVLGGVGGQHWEPIQAFCERQEIPQIFPNVDAPAVSGYYSLYFNRGPALEADVLARELRDRQTDPRTVVQVYRAGSRGEEAARTFRSALGEGLQEVTLSDDGLSILPTAYADSQRTWVLWLDARDLQAFTSQPRRWQAANAIYVSGSLADPGSGLMDDALRGKVRVVYPFDLPESRGVRLSRVKIWLEARHVALTDERIQANTFFATTVAGEALDHLGRIFSRDFFVERIEHMSSRLLNTSIYPRISLGPGQRYASKGGYIVAIADGPARRLVPQGEWIVP